MALIYIDRAQELSRTTGTGTYDLEGAVVGYQSFADVGDGNTCYYGATDGRSWEVGLGTYVASNSRLIRTDILDGSNGTSPVNWLAGNKYVWVDYPAEVINNTISGLTVATANGFAGTVSPGGNPEITLETTVTGILEGNGTGISAVSGFIPTTAGGEANVQDRAALSAVDTTRNTVAYLMETGRQGWFQWDSSNLSAPVAIDTQQGVYVAPASAPVGASGAWVRVEKSIVTPQMFGASTSASATDNSIAFRALAAYITFKGGGHVQIAGGQLTVFYQTVNPSPSSGTQYYQTAAVALMTFNACTGLIIEFVGGASLKAADGLHYGAFDPITGLPYENGAPFSNPAYIAQPGIFINVTNCSNVQITNTKIVGNISNGVIGGRYGDTGIQLDWTGIRLQDCVGVEVHTADIRSCGLDGISVGTSTDDFTVNTVMTNIISDYNGRQGFSWTGGFGLQVVNCEFAHTGKGGLFSSPGAGMDIEGPSLGNGVFTSCSFFDCAGPSVVNDVSTANGTVVFNGCTMQNPDTQHAFWYANPTGAILNDCSIYGDIVNVNVCTFNRCFLTNGPWFNGVSSRVLLADVNSAAKFIDCVFNMAQQTSYNIYLRGGAIARRCRFIFSAAVATARLNVAILSCVLEDCTFEQAYGNDAAASPAGEHTWIDPAGSAALHKGKNTLSGAALAWGGRAGSVNISLMQASKTYDPPSIAAGATAPTTINMESVLVGDYASASFSLSLGGLIMSPQVTSTNTVTVTLFNPTAAPIDLASGTLSSRVVHT